MHEHGLVLADAMGAVDGLILHRRVPPGIIEDHRIGGGEIEADASGLEADEKDPRAPVLKIVDLLRRSRVSPVSSE